MGCACTVTTSDSFKMGPHIFCRGPSGLTVGFLNGRLMSLPPVTSMRAPAPESTESSGENLDHFLETNDQSHVNCCCRCCCCCWLLLVVAGCCCLLLCVAVWHVYLYVLLHLLYYYYCSCSSCSCSCCCCSSSSSSSSSCSCSSFCSCSSCCCCWGYWIGDGIHNYSLSSGNLTVHGSSAETLIPKNVRGFM